MKIRNELIDFININIMHQFDLYIWSTIPVKIPESVNYISWCSISNKNSFGELTLLDFKTYYKGTVIKSAQQWAKNIYISKRNRILSRKEAQIQFWQTARAIKWEKNSVFSKLHWNNLISLCDIPFIK